MPLHPEFIRKCSDPSDMHCFMPVVYQMALEASNLHPACKMVELGVRTGYSTTSILAALAMSGTGGHLYSCDIEPCLGTQEGMPEDLKVYWTFTQADSVNFADQFSEGSVQLLFIDTDHSYELTRAELFAWTTRLAPGARILLHDTCSVPDGVGRAVQGYLTQYSDSRYYNIDAYAGLGVLSRP